MDRLGLSLPELARLKRVGRTRRISAFQAAIVKWRPSRSLGERLHDERVTFFGDLTRVRHRLPELVGSEFLFALGLWVAVFVVAAAVMSTAEIPLRSRYAVGLAALTYLYLYAELARVSRPIPGRTILLSAADGAVAIIIYLVSSPVVWYGELLLVIAAVRMVGRFQDLRAVPAAILIGLPFVIRQSGPPIGIVLEGFGTLLLLLTIQHLLELATRARVDSGRQATLASLSSAIARATDADALMGHLVSLAPALLPGAAWAFWLRDASSGDYRSQRWYGLPVGERPVTTFTPSLGPDRSEPIAIVGPMPGTACGDKTVVQPMVWEGEVMGLITVSGGSEIEDGTAAALRPIAEESALVLTRLQALTDERRRLDTMEMANRLAGIAASRPQDQASSLSALLPALSEALRCDSLHLEWVDGDDLRLVVPSRDPLFLNAPPRLPVAQTRSSEAVLGRSLREPVSGRRPEDVVLAAAGIRHVVVVPLTSGGLVGTLQVGRREPRAFTVSEASLLEMLAERLARVFEADVIDPAPSSVDPAGQGQVGQP